MDAKLKKDRLDAEVSALAFHWALYRSIYATPGNVDMMNTICPVGFGLMQRSVAVDIIRRLCAITEKSNNGSNLVLRTVAEAWAKETGKTVPPHVDARITEAEASAQPLRTYRNKVIAHFDTSTLCGNKSVPQVVNQHIEDAISKVFSAMTAVSVCVDGTDVAYGLAMIDNAEGQWQWMLTDVLRFRHLRSLAHDPKNTDEEIRRLLKRRSGKTDPRILPSIEQEEEEDG